MLYDDFWYSPGPTDSGKYVYIYILYIIYMRVHMHCDGCSTPLVFCNENLFHILRKT